MQTRPYTLSAILLLLAGCAQPTAHTEAPEPTASQYARYIGDYYGSADTVFIRENDGRLEAVVKRMPHVLQHFTNDSFGYDNVRMVLGGDAIVIRAASGDAAASGGAARSGGAADTLRRRTVAAGTFKIKPLKPVADLRALALNAKPPAQPDTLLKPDLVELASLDPTIKYDIRYATTNNFMGDVFYSSAHAFMQRPAAEAVVRAHRKLRAMGFGLLIHDAYRPWYVTKMFWEATPDSLKDFVADPASGSRHNRGAAVDLTLYDLKTGNPVEMTGGYDEFSERSYPTYPGGTTVQRWRRGLLKSVMEAEGFRVYNVEWWHFDYNDWRRYPVSNLTFEQLLH